MGERWSRLIELRENRSLSQGELAKVLGLSRSGLSMYEIGDREPNLAIIRRLADYFQVTTDYLLGRTSDPQSGSNEPVPEEWRAIIWRSQAMGLSPDQVLRALGGLSIISEALLGKGSGGDGAGGVGRDSSLEGKGRGGGRKGK